MINFRIIPKLEIKNNNLVKGINYEGLRVLGNPIDFIEDYSLNLADEIFLQDVTASLYGIKISEQFVQSILKKTFVPVLFGGGISSIEDIDLLLNIGIDKFSLNTSALKKPKLISEIANHIGSSNLVLSIECKKINNQYYAYGEMGRFNSGKKIEHWIVEIISLGAGEIIINSIDNDGTGKGYDIDLIEKINNIPTSVPIVISGGIGKKEDILDLIQNYNFNAVVIASILHYKIFSEYKNKINTQIGNKNYIKNNDYKKNIESCYLKDIKKFLKNNLTNKSLINYDEEIKI